MIAVMKILLIVFLAISGIMAVRLRRSWNGNPMAVQEAPFFASIRDQHGHKCGGALISLKHVLTAAHCLLDDDLQSIPNLEVVLGAQSRSAAGSQQQIDLVIYPRTFRPSDRFHDLAVISLLRLIKEMDFPRRIEMSSAQPPYTEVATFVAFDHRLNENRKHLLNELKFMVLPAERCAQHKSHENFLGSNMFCGKHQNGEKLDSTDLGGPLVLDGKLIGIASWIARRTNDLIPYYMAVNSFSDFINEARKCSYTMCASSTCAVLRYKPFSD